MAGLIFIPAAILAYFLTLAVSALFFGTAPVPTATAWLTIAFTLGMLGVGAADDIMKFRNKGNEGLTEKQKTIGLLAVTLPFATWHSSSRTSRVLARRRPLSLLYVTCPSTCSRRVRSSAAS